ncbi:MAG: hypothetical protein QW227_01105 [Candidatus Aenigmatarchaeota archaeon]
MTIEDYLTRARKFARAGKPRPMEVHLDIAQEYARRIGKNIPAEEVEEIRKTGYENGINRELAEAERYARDGKPPRLIEMYLIDAKKYAEHIGKDISAEVEEIQKFWLRKS